VQNQCPECGARLSAGELCSDRFNLLLALEFENPDTFGSVHHLTVACYMLQHNLYSRRAWLLTREMLDQVINHDVAPEVIRKLNRRELDSNKRDWKITAGSNLQGVDAIQWSRNIADVGIESPESYCEDVKLWAKSLLADSESLV
jgi:hypothetical protein